MNPLSPFVKILMTRVLVGMMIHKFCSLKWLYLAGILIFIIVTIIFIAKPNFSQTHHEDTYIAKVNGEEIHVSEFQRAIKANKAGIINYFYEKYDAGQSAVFWSTPFGNEIPLELIKEKARSHVGWKSTNGFNRYSFIQT